jgi:membrane protein involved in colicin uptake
MFIGGGGRGLTMLSDSQCREFAQALTRYKQDPEVAANPQLLRKINTAIGQVNQGGQMFMFHQMANPNQKRDLEDLLHSMQTFFAQRKLRQQQQQQEQQQQQHQWQLLQQQQQQQQQQQRQQPQRNLQAEEEAMIERAMQLSLADQLHRPAAAAAPAPAPAAAAVVNPRIAHLSAAAVANQRSRAEPLAVAAAASGPRLGALAEDEKQAMAAAAMAVPLTANCFTNL